MRQLCRSSVARWSKAFSPIPALLLAFTLALAVGIAPAPTLLLAAPAAQEDDPAILGYYESDLIPGQGDTPDLIVGLILYEDGSAEVISEYQNDTDAIIEIGTWVDNDDGTLTLTVTGTTDGDYAAPIDLDFEVAEDGSLVVPGAANGAFGEAGLVLIPTALGNSETILAQIPADALIFQSDVLPAASGPGLQLTLAIFDDGSLTLVSDYMNPGDIVVEIGTWSESEDGSLVITLTGQVEDGDGAVTEYEEPLEFVFTVNDDNSLALVDEGGALFGDAGLTLIPTEATSEAMTAATEEEATGEEEATAEATAEDTTAEEESTAEATEEPTPEATPTATEEAVVAEETPEPSEEEGTEEPATGEEGAPEADEEAGEVMDMLPAGVYISDLLPSNDGSGTFLVTIFHEDGSIVFSTYPLNGEPPVTEVGIWADNLDGTYTITATGTLDEEYDQPFEILFTMDEDGIVTIADVPFYALADIDLAGAANVVAEFQSDVITDTIELAHTLTLVAYDDSSAELITTYTATEGGYTEYGEWEIDEATDQFTLTLTSDDDVVYVEPIVWVFDVTADDTLVLVNDEEGYYGDDGLTLVAVEAEEDGVVEEEATGEEVTTGGEEATVEEAALEGAQLFQSEVLPAAASPGLQLTLGLLDDGRAALDFDYLNDEEIVTNLGEWMDNDDGTITLTLTEGPNGALELPVELTLELDDEGNLVIIDASEESLGLIDVVLAPVVLE